jgi:AraC-like DNA-binding protein
MSVILQKWTHVVETPEAHIILPDGCRDLILYEAPKVAPVWRLSPLQAGPESAAITLGTRLTGFRLAPGTFVPEDLVHLLPDNPMVAETDIMAAVLAQTDGADAISAIKEAPSVAAAARTLGVSSRSLQRALVRDTGFAPAFWLRLARVRRAAARVDQSLADLAADCGFSDQSHMTREFQHWFGLGPRSLRGSVILKEQIRQPALATGEQISIK